MKCSAKRTDGNPCKAPAIRGATVCRVHGGSAPQVKKAAARRVLEALVAPALIQLRKIVEDENTPTAVRLAAVRDILDRTGFASVKQVEVFSLDMVDAEIQRLESELAEYDADTAT